MIRINLIRGKRKKGRELNFDFLYLLVPLAFLGGVFFYHQTLTARLEKSATDIQAAQTEIIRLKKEIGEVEKFKVRKAELQKKVDIISSLQANRTGPLKTFEALTASVPEKCWLESLKIEGRKVTATGMALNNNTIANFMTALGQSGRFTDVTLGSADQASYLDTKLVRFNLTFQTTDNTAQQRPG
ncbi:MAG TPA: PilN domain-containing protein [Candidatus Deferrimicrobiaceae bacterium]|jgi:type IV pilus assembly protein PilN